MSTEAKQPSEDAPLRRADPTPDRCPDCGSDRLVRDDRDEVYCNSCGLVLEDAPIDPGPDWRAFDAGERDDRARAGAPMTYTLHDKGLTTTMGWPGKDSYGNAVPKKTRSQLHRLRKWNRRLRLSTGGERNMAQALSELQRMSTRIGAPRAVRETASVLYRRAMEQDLVRGRSIDAVAAASLYAACRQHQVPRTLEEIADVSPADRKEVARAYRALARELGLKIRPTTPLDFVSRFAEELGVSPETRARAIEILQEATDQGLTGGKSPTGVAGAALYLAALDSGDHRTQSDVAEVAHVSEVTVRNRMRDLEGLVA